MRIVSAKGGLVSVVISSFSPPAAKTTPYTSVDFVHIPQIVASLFDMDKHLTGPGSGQVLFQMLEVQ